MAQALEAWGMVPSAPCGLSCRAAPGREFRLLCSLHREIDQPLPIRHRHQVAVDEIQPPAAAPIQKNAVGQGVELRLVDHFEAAQRQLLSRVQRDMRLVRHEKAVLGKRPCEFRSRPMLRLEFAAEIDRLLYNARRLATLEEE